MFNKTRKPQRSHALQVCGDANPKGWACRRRGGRKGERENGTRDRLNSCTMLGIQLPLFFSHASTNGVTLSRASRRENTKRTTGLVLNHKRSVNPSRASQAAKVYLLDPYHQGAAPWGRTNPYPNGSPRPDPNPPLNPLAKNGKTRLNKYEKKVQHARSTFHSSV